MTQVTYSNVFSMYSELTVRIHATIRPQYILGYNFRNTHTIHPRYMCIQMYSDQRHQDTLGYNTIQRKCMYLPLGCLCAPRYALNTPKIRVSAPSLPAFTFFTCPGPPEEGLAPMYPMYSGMHIPRSLQVPLYASLHTLNTLSPRALCTLLACLHILHLPWAPRRRACSSSSSLESGSR